MSFHFFIGIYQYNFLSQKNEAIFAFLLLESRLPFIFSLLSLLNFLDYPVCR